MNKAALALLLTCTVAAPAQAQNYLELSTYGAGLDLNGFLLGTTHQGESYAGARTHTPQWQNMSLGVSLRVQQTHYIQHLHDPMQLELAQHWGTRVRTVLGVGQQSAHYSVGVAW